MNDKDRTLVLFIAIALYLFLIPSAMASTEEQQTNRTKDAAQLKMEALETELGEEGMKEVADYLELQASLPDVVKASPYSSIAFAATDNESQVAYLTAIDESDLEKENKEKLKADLQDIWNRYPDKFVVADNLVLRDVAKIMDERLIVSVNLSEIGVDSPDDGNVSSSGMTENAGTTDEQEKESNTTQESNSTSFISSYWVLAIVLGTVMYARRK
ncbi:hypothetical protein [Methanosarcina acetivorans]|uniref:Uncharacterized protein n=1 Tax=Methanosarcina acetivorans (strain ATCC 35395 / DSM 2834 / JCM 12185 / C2A) TaxID=188937 RepID=Q8TP99_METAC|nr:hypothetical protein [Methanosarcina acetivorans]AAM05418.1 predicted protein [Methanosarcina acetivorans C2A]